MQKQLKLSIVTPLGVIADSKEIKSVILPGTDGEFGVLQGHASVVSSLDAGLIEIIEDDSSHSIVAIDWGYVDVEEDSVNIVANGAVAISGSKEVKQNIDDAKKLLESSYSSEVASRLLDTKISTLR